MRSTVADEYSGSKGGFMLSNRTKATLGLSTGMVLTAFLFSRCAGVQPELDRRISPPTSPDHGAFHREQKSLRQRLQPQAGDSGVVIDDNNTIILGISPNDAGSPNLTRLPSEMHVKQGNTPRLTWVCWEGPFELTFLPRGAAQESPLENMQTRVDGGPSIPSTASATVRKDAPKDRYNFAIRIYLDGGVVVEDPDCPPIIVE